MLKKLIYHILIFNFMVVNAQLNQEPKNITKKFFSELNSLENITPALKKKKGFTNYKELLTYIDEKVQKLYNGTEADSFLFVGTMHVTLFFS